MATIEDIRARGMARADKIRELLEKNTPVKQIAFMLGVGHQNISQILARYPVDRPMTWPVKRGAPTKTANIEAAKAGLRRQIELAKYEMPTAPLYRPGPDKDAG